MKLMTTQIFTYCKLINQMNEINHTWWIYITNLWHHCHESNLTMVKKSHHVSNICVKSIFTKPHPGFKPSTIQYVMQNTLQYIFFQSIYNFKNDPSLHLTIHQRDALWIPKALALIYRNLFFFFFSFFFQNKPWGSSTDQNSSITLRCNPHYVEITNSKRVDCSVLKP